MYGGLVAVMFFVQKAWVRVGLAVVGLALLVKLAIDPIRTYPYFHYGIRAYISMAFTVCGVLLWWYQYRMKRVTNAPSQFFPAVMASILLITLSIFDIGMSLDFSESVNTFRSEVNAKTGLVKYESSGLMMNPDAQRFMWVWNFPLMSVVLRDNSQKAIILNPVWSKGYQPFDPRHNVPDLDRYYQ